MNSISMKGFGGRSLAITPLVILLVMVCSDGFHHAVHAGGFGGRGGGGGRSFGGGGVRANLGGGSVRPNFGGGQVSRPNFNYGGARPNLGGAVNRPSLSGGAHSSPALPSLNRPDINRPSISRPDINRPAVTRPGVTRPTTDRPSIGGPNADRPNITRPNPGRPDLTRPDAGRPSNGRPDTGRPDTGRPNTGRPNTGRPNTGRPNTGRPDTGRPDTGRPDTGRPDTGRPNTGRPSANQVGNFLGLDRPIRPDNQYNRPATLPGRVPDRRPNLGGASGIGGSGNHATGNLIDRDKINIGEINLGNNNVISNRPFWSNIERDQFAQINRRWSSQLSSIGNWQNRYPDRFNLRREWGNDVRRRWIDPDFSHPGHDRPSYFRPAWWRRHPFAFGGWSYCYALNAYPYMYWYTTPTYVQTAQWVSTPEATMSSQSPVYYDYGDGGNVTIEDNRVYIGGEDVASTEDFAQSAATLATVDPPADEDAAKDAEWLPLGTFALTTDRDNVNPNQVVQLAVAKTGIISGTLYNEATDKTQAIQGSVDKETQRVAIRLGESEIVIAETGLYNLTQDEASVLVHFGKEKTETYLLVRLEEPADQDQVDNQVDNQELDAEKDRNGASE